MGKHYRADVTDGPIGFIRAMWKSARWCQWVEPSAGAQGEGKGVMFFRNRNGLGVPPVKIAAPGTEQKKEGMIVGCESDADA